jgi:hypothetical protein
MYEKLKFDFIFAQDMEGINMVKEELINYERDNCVKFLAQTSSQNPKTIPESFAIKCNAKRFVQDYYIYRDGFKSKMVLDIENKPIGGMPNVGMSVIQLALYMNPRNLYIVGCDMSGTHNITGNMTKDELNALKKQYDAYWKKEQKRLLDKWNEIKKFAETYYPDTKIISVNPVGLKGVFNDLYQENYEEEK